MPIVPRTQKQAPAGSALNDKARVQKAYENELKNNNQREFEKDTPAGAFVDEAVGTVVGGAAHQAEPVLNIYRHLGKGDVGGATRAWGQAWLAMPDPINVAIDVGKAAIANVKTVQRGGRLADVPETSDVEVARSSARLTVAWASLAFLFLGLRGGGGATRSLGDLAGDVEGGIGSKAPSLPAWDKVTVDMEHIMRRHTEGGAEAEGKTIFPSTMSEAGIKAGIREAYSNASKNKVQRLGENIRLTGTSSSIPIIDMWLEPDNTIRTAYPVTPGPRGGASSR
jgi:hypothetical protein